MCITKEVSISTFFICTISCIYLYQRNKRNDRWVALLFGYIGLMQFLEYLMWTDQECSGINQKATRVAFYIIILQPLVSVLIAYYMTNGKIPPWLYMIEIIYVIYAIPRLYSKLEENQCTKPCDGSHMGLNWLWVVDNSLVWLIFFCGLVSPLLLMKPNGYIYCILNFIIWILSYIIGSYRCNGDVDIPSGSLWCLMAFMGPLFAIFMNK